MTWLIAIILLLLLFGAREIVISWGNDEKKVMMWEILVPASGKEQEFPFEHHKAWDEFVRNMAGGLTILKTAKGEWISPDGTLFKDRVIPVRINCNKKQIKKIIRFTIRHYNQEAVLAYKISNRVLLIYRDENK